MSDEIRPFPRFSDQAINAQVDSIIGALPENAKVAVVAHSDLYEAKLAVLFNLGGGWSFGGYLDKPYKGQLTAGAELRFVL